MQHSKEYKQYRDLIESTLDLIFTVDRKGLFIYVNPTFEMATGYSLFELIDRPFTDVIAPEFRKKVVSQFINGIKGTKDVPYEVDILHKDGSRISVEFNVATLHDENKKPVGRYGIGRDITERKKSETVLRGAKDILQSIIQGFPIAAFIISRDHRVLYWNFALEELSGIRAVDVMGTSEHWRAFYGSQRPCMADLLVDGAHELVDRWYAGKVQKSSLIEGSYEALDFFPSLGPNGRWLRFMAATIRDAAGNLIGAIETLEDVTERKRTEDALRESEERYRHYVDKSFAGVYVVQNGLFVFLNDNAASFAGYKPQELIGKPSSSLIHPEDRDRAREKTIRMLKGEKSLPYEFRVLTKDGQVRWILETVTSIQYAGASAILGNSMDITERRRAEEALHESRELEKSILISVPHALFGVENRRIFFANDAMEHVFGWKPQDLIGQSTRIIFRNEQEWEEYGALLYSRLKMEPVVVFEWQNPFVRKDGKEIFCRMSVSRTGMELGESRRIVATFEDITERVKTERALRESRDLLDATGRLARVGGWEWDVLEQTMIWTDETYRIHGFLPGEIVAGSSAHIERSLACYDPNDRLVIAAAFQRCATEGEPYDLEFPMFTADNRRIWIRTMAKPLWEGGRVVKVIGNIMDITERKRTEDALRESERRLTDIIEFFPDATLVIDDKGCVIAWNRAMEIMTGVAKQDIIGRGDYEYALPFYGERRPILIDLALHPDDRIEKQYTALQRSGEVLFGEAYTPRLGPGNIHLSASASILRNSQGDVIGAIQCIRNNTERKNLEERLVQSQKMEALGLLAGGVAHDLNNVLGVLVGYSELMLHDMETDSRFRKHAESILTAGERAATIVQDMLALARRGIHASTVVDLNRTVRDYMRSPEYANLNSSSPRCIVTMQLEEPILRIKGSSAHLGKVLANLVLNAAESMPAGGMVTIRTQNRYLDHPVRGYTEVQAGDYVVLSVTDTGQGISEEDKRRIFEPFYTKKIMGRSGSGLGLAVVWGTVKDHAGYIEVESLLGEGTTFTLYFPVTREEFQQEVSIPVAAFMGRGEAILIVDDVKEQRELAAYMLGKLDYRVTPVSSGEEAVEYLKTGRADLVVLDMIMDPGMDGLETYRKIIEIHPRQKAVIVSGYAETDRVRKAQALGAGAYIRKPYILERLGLAVRHELDRQDP
jgi:PAS domain S-box-containing protein